MSKHPMWNPNPPNIIKICKSMNFLTWADRPCGTLTLENIIKLFLNQRILFTWADRPCGTLTLENIIKIFLNQRIFLLVNEQTSNVEP